MWRCFFSYTFAIATTVTTSITKTAAICSMWRRMRRRRWWWWWWWWGGGGGEGFCNGSCAGFLTSETRITSKLYSWNSRSPLVATRPKLATTTAASKRLQIFDCNRSRSGATQTKTDSTTNGKAVGAKRALYDKSAVVIARVCKGRLPPHYPPPPPNWTPQPPFFICFQFVFLYFYFFVVCNVTTLGWLGRKQSLEVKSWGPMLELKVGFFYKLFINK